MAVFLETGAGKPGLLRMTKDKDQGHGRGNGKQVGDGAPPWRGQEAGGVAALTALPCHITPHGSQNATMIPPGADAGRMHAMPQAREEREFAGSSEINKRYLVPRSH